MHSLDLVGLTGIKANFKILNHNRVGDHKWWISSIKKFKKHYPNWNIKHNVTKIIKDIIESENNGNK